MDITNIELEPLASSAGSVSPQRPARVRGVAEWLAIGMAVVAAGPLGVLVVSNDAGTRSSTDQSQVEQPVAVLPAAATDPTSAFAAERYLACLPQGGGSADALEHRSADCRRELERALFPGDRSDPCVPAGAGSADGLERWVEHCHRETVGRLLAASTGGG